MTKKRRVIFMGSPDFSVPALDALHAEGHDIAAVYCQPPRPAGRGKKERPTPVHARALELGLTVRHPNSLKDPAEQTAFADLQADIAVVVAYGLLLPQAVLDAPALGCVNIHASLLPRWRGAAPIHRAIMAGDTETGVSIMQMEAGLDTGPVLLTQTLPITAQDTTATLHDSLAAMGVNMILQTLDQIENLTRQPQPDKGVTYAKKIDKSEARIDWAWRASEVDHHIRGLSPFPGAWAEWNGERIKLLNSKQSQGCGAPGLILDDQLTVACGQGAVILKRLQRAGRSAQDSADFLRGTEIKKGGILR